MHFPLFEVCVLIILMGFNLVNNVGVKRPSHEWLEPSNCGFDSLDVNSWFNNVTVCETYAATVL